MRLLEDSSGHLHGRTSSQHGEIVQTYLSVGPLTLKKNSMSQTLNEGVYIVIKPVSLSLLEAGLIVHHYFWWAMPRL